jgi:hypothetical protein
MAIIGFSIGYGVLLAESIGAHGSDDPGLSNYHSRILDGRKSRCFVSFLASNNECTGWQVLPFTSSFVPNPHECLR